MIFVLLASGLRSPAAALSVVGPKHDLSAGSGTTQICVFCHTPHKPKANVPLWNHFVTTQTFTFYSSNYLNTWLGSTQPTMADLPGTLTELCLSCHDGMTALGNVYNLGGESISKPQTIAGVANLGTGLADDHPVLYDVKPGAGPPELSRLHPDPAAARATR